MVNVLCICVEIRTMKTLEIFLRRRGNEGK
jgi:hypothetical protein